MPLMRWPFLILMTMLLPWSAQPPRVTFAKVYALKPSEGVFAYARISPDGRTLAYASEMPDPSGNNRITTTQTVVDLGTKRVLFTEPGIDAYWSLDGQRMIYLSQAGNSNVTIRHGGSGALTRSVAPVGLGDYFSWARRDGRDLILTIQSNYYYLDGDRGVLPAGRVATCPDIGVGDRPLISKDGRRISTFVRGNVVVRNLDNCENIVDTGLQGAKADFSWDGRYVAFHVPKPQSRAYQIVVVDTVKKTMRTVTDLPGSSLFPSWTEDGRLCFRYDGDDYRGFMMASHVLSAPEGPLPTAGSRILADAAWTDLFPETPAPAHRMNLVLIWSAWSAHAPMALADLQDAAGTFAREHVDVGALTALDLSSQRADADRILRYSRVRLPEIPLAPSRFAATEGVNQMPTTLLFRDGRLIDRRLGAQSASDLRAWVASRSLGQ